MENHTKVLAAKMRYPISSYLRFICFSLLGLFIFFVPLTITIHGTSYHSIPIDLIITLIKVYAPWVGPLAALIFVTIGGITAWTNKSYKKSTLYFIMAIFRTLGIPLVFMAYFNVGPSWLLAEDILPAVFKNITVSVSYIVPVGGVFLAFIINYGLLEFIGVLVRPVMRPLFRVPGKSAVDAVASFVGSFSVAMLLTNQLYRSSKYTYREAIIIMTGFSTASATFMIVIAKTAGFMHIWNFYFWSTLIITFLVTAITIRIPPLSKFDNTYFDGKGKPEIRNTSINPLFQAVQEGLSTASSAPPLPQNLWINLKGAIKMIMVLAPTGASIGTIAFILVKMTPTFDILGYIFFPITYLLSLIGLPDPMLVAKVSAVSLGEMFVPNTLVASALPAIRYIIAVVSVSEIIFFGGYIPCLYATDIKVSMPKLLVIWFERTALSMIFAGIVALLFF